MIKARMVELTFFHSKGVWIKKEADAPQPGGNPKKKPRERQVGGRK